MTGGWYYGATATVGVYDVNGFVEYLPNMTHPRQNHACGHYIDSNSNIV